jgi:hypothetical protein
MKLYGFGYELKLNTSLLKGSLFGDNYGSLPFRQQSPQHEITKAETLKNSPNTQFAIC